MSCQTPLAFETLVDYWSGELTADRADAVEEHLFACDECAASQTRLARLVGGLRDAIPVVISPAHRERLVAAGLRIHVTPVESGTPAHARFSADRDLLVHALRADLSRAERVDLDLLTDDGTPKLSLVGAPFDRERGEVLVCCQRHYQQFGDSPTFRVHAVEGGVRRQAGEYLVHHEWS